MARRVWRDEAWTWVSRPASRARYLAGDRHDIVRGDVYPGEIVAEYTLGGNTEPDAWFVVVADNGDGKPLRRLAVVKRRDGYSLTHKRMEGDIVVPSPYWRTP